MLHDPQTAYFPPSAHHPKKNNLVILANHEVDGLAQISAAASPPRRALLNAASTASRACGRSSILPPREKRFHKSHCPSVWEATQVFQQMKVKKRHQSNVSSSIWATSIRLTSVGSRRWCQNYASTCRLLNGYGINDIPNASYRSHKTIANFSPQVTHMHVKRVAEVFFRAKYPFFQIPSRKHTRSARSINVSSSAYSLAVSSTWRALTVTRRIGI